MMYDQISIQSNKLNVSDYKFIKDFSKDSEIFNKSTKNRLLEFIVLIESLKIKNEVTNVFEMTKEVLKKSGLYKHFSDDESIDGINRIQNIEELLNGIKDFIDNDVSEEKTVSSFLQSVALITDQDNEEQDSNKVQLMTVHLAKGLEFPYVYIVGMEENLFPSAMNLNSRNELEEERRLFYVALTRAEKKFFYDTVFEDIVGGS